MTKCNVLLRSTRFILLFLMMGLPVGNAYAQTCVPGTLATGQYDPAPYRPVTDLFGVLINTITGGDDEDDDNDNDDAQEVSDTDDGDEDD